MTSDTDPDKFTPLPWGMTATGNCVIYDDEIYIMGGGAMENPYANPVTHILPQTHIYNPTTKEWKLGPNMITPREAISPILHGNKIFVFGSSPSMAWDYSNVVEHLLIEDVPASSIMTEAPGTIAPHHYGLDYSSASSISVSYSFLVLRNESKKCGMFLFKKNKINCTTG